MGLGACGLEIAARIIARRHDKRARYQLAASKEELFLVVLDRIMRRIARQGRDAIAQQHDPVKRIVAMGTTAANGVGALSPTLMQAIHDYSPAKLLFEHHIAAARSTLEALITDATEQQCLRPANASMPQPPRSRSRSTSSSPEPKPAGDGAGG